MTDDEKKLQENILRVAGNLIVLIDVGLFPGKLVVGLAEARGFVESIANDAKAKLAPTIQPPPPPAVAAIVSLPTPPPVVAPSVVDPLAA